jgi:prophage regulatory protein
MQNDAPHSNPLEMQMTAIYLTDRQIGVRYNVHHLTPRRWAKDDPTFPKPIRLTPGCTRWKLSDIEAWEEAKANAE